MKRVWAAGLVALVAIGMIVYGSWFVDTTFDEMSEGLNQALIFSQWGEYEKADGIYRRLVEDWEEKEKGLGLFLKHDILSEISGMIRETAAYNDAQHQAELKSETARTLDRIRTAHALFFTVC